MIEVSNILFSILTLRMRYHTFLRRSTYRRYGIFVITILLSRYGLQAYINSRNITLQIQEVEDEIERLVEETNYMQKFYANYLQSKYAHYFLGHENGILYPGEKIIRLKHNVEYNDDVFQDLYNYKQNVLLTSPEESWKYFIDQKFPFLKEIGKKRK